MDIPLSITKGPKLDLFLAYFNAELSKRAVILGSTYKVTADKIFTTILDIKLGELFDHLQLVWALEMTPNGELSCMRISPYEATIEVHSDWKTTANNIITTALISAFNEKRIKTTIRKIFYYIGPRLDGEYWIRNIRIAPASDDNNFPAAMNFERALVMDFEVDAIDKYDSIYLASELSRRVAARLSFLLDFDIYENPGDHVWVHTLNNSKSERLNRGTLNIPPLSTLPKKGSECSAGDYGDSIISLGRTIGTLKMPKEARKIIKAIEESSRAEQDAFDGAVRLYQIGLSLARRFPTAALAYRVAAIDALQLGELSCNGFSQFMQKYSPAEKDTLDYLHSTIRSAHFHAGKFEMGEFTAERHMDAVHDQDTALKPYLLMQCSYLMREAIATWALSKVQE